MTEPQDQDSADSGGHLTRAQATQRRVDQGLFLEAYAVTGNVSAAAKRSNVHRQRHYEWLAQDAKYQADFKDADDQAQDALETEARRRATEGVPKPIYQGGRLMEVVYEYSDTLLMFLMKGGNPTKYRENAKPLDAEGSGPPDGGMTWDEQRDLRHAIARAKGDAEPS